MEGKISFTSFCDGLAWKTGFFNRELKLCLTRFSKTDCIDQFRLFRRQQSTLSDVSQNFKGSTHCSACPKKNGSQHICFDGNMALVSKLSASKSTKATSRSEMFVPDEEVTRFMENYDESSKDKECSNYQAGTNLRSKSKRNKLNVTGVFGASCRHEFPLMFINMRHGERLGYPVLLLQKLLNNSYEKNIQMHIIYDIACVLKRHLLRKGTLANFSNFKFGLPVFHSYGHKGDYQVENSIRRLEGFGLMDGELMEHLWSYLRPFCKATKEMTPAHRTDLLCDALLHFGAIKMENIAYALSFQKKKAKDTIVSCTEELQNLSAEVAGDLNDELLKSWKKEEDLAITFKKSKTITD